MKKAVIYKIIDEKSVRRRSSRRAFLSIFAIFTLAAVLSFVGTRDMSHTMAVDISGFKAGNIISDSVMRNYTSMTEAEIQAFLKSKNRCNDTNLQKVGNRVDYLSESSPYSWHVVDGHFVCMADEDFNGESVAHIIWEAAQDYKINPQVLIVLLQKEQGLITDTFPHSIQYRSATGYGCPDNDKCSSKYYGIKNQIRNAASLFNTVLSGGWTNYPVGWNNIRYSTNESCGSSKVYIENLATSALYRYTPYQPNEAALAAYKGSATCGAYGNRNFYIYFLEWFGSTQNVQYTFSQNYYNRNKATTGKITGVMTCKKADGTTADTTKPGTYYCHQDFEKGSLFWTHEFNDVKVETDSDEFFLDSATAAAYKTYSYDQVKTYGKVVNGSSATITDPSDGKVYAALKFEDAYVMKNESSVKVITDMIIKAAMDNVKLIGVATGEPKVYENDQNLRILNAEKGVVLGNDEKGYFALTQAAFEGWERNRDFLGYPISERHINEKNYDKTGFEWQDFEHALMMGNSDSGWYIGYGRILVAWQRNGYETGPLGFPTSDIQKNGKYTWQNFKRGLVMGTDETGYFYAYGKSLVAWQKTGYEFGPLKYPLSDLVCDNKTKLCSQKYQGGYIVGNDTNGYYESRGNIRTKWLRAGGASGYYGFPKGNIVRGCQQYQRGLICN